MILFCCVCVRGWKRERKNFTRKRVQWIFRWIICLTYLTSNSYSILLIIYWISIIENRSSLNVMYVNVFFWQTRFHFHAKFEAILKTSLSKLIELVRNGRYVFYSKAFFSVSDSFLVSFFSVFDRSVGYLTIKNLFYNRTKSEQCFDLNRTIIKINIYAVSMSFALPIIFLCSVNIWLSFNTLIATLLFLLFHFDNGIYWMQLKSSLSLIKQTISGDLMKFCIGAKYTPSEFRAHISVISIPSNL